MLPVIAEAGGYKFRYLLYATPGQEYYHASRRLVLKGADAIIFVVDSQRERVQENHDSAELLKKNLAELGQRPEYIPTVIEFNKRDLATAIPIEDAERRFNTGHNLSFPAVARTGDGVAEVFLTAAKMALTRLSQPGAEEKMGALFRTTVLAEEDAAVLKDRLAKLNREGGLIGSLLVDESSGVLSSAGEVPSNDLETLGALLACNFAAAQELAANLSGASFSGTMQRGKRWLLRAYRVDDRRFLVMACAAGTDRRRVRDAATYFKGPLAAYLEQVDKVSPNRLSRLSDLFSSVTQLAVTSLAG
jgi:predicted regulator of Ras-like GTPase activity (Roadblock/LC7/MglB family)